MSADRRLFVYGLLRRDCDHPMARRLEQDARHVGPATLQGKLYDLGGYPGVVDSGDSQDRVHGDIFEIVGDAEKLLQDLDVFEGCDAESEEPHEYRRVTREAMLDGAMVTAQIYLYNLDPAGKTLIPDGDFLAWRSKTTGEGEA